MSFRVHCPSCGKNGRVPVEYHGQRVRCSRCRHTFQPHGDLEELVGAFLAAEEDDGRGRVYEDGDVQL